MTLTELLESAPCLPTCHFDGYGIDDKHYECIAADIEARRDEYLKAMGGGKLADYRFNAWTFPGTPEHRIADEFGMDGF